MAAGRAEGRRAVRTGRERRRRRAGRSRRREVGSGMRESD